MGDFEKMKMEAVAQTLIEYYKSRGLYNAILKILEGFLLEELTLQEQAPYPSAQQKPRNFLVEEVERSLEEKRKLIMQNNGVDSIEFQEIDCNDLRFLNENEVHNQIYSNIKEEIVHEAFRVLHLLSDGESYRQSGDKDDLSTLVTDEFIKLLEDTYRDNPEFHFIPSMAFNQILQSYGEHLNSRERVVSPGWKKIFVAVYHAKHFYGCIAHVREKKLYIVDSCDGVTINSYQSTVLILLAYMSRELDVTQENWIVHIVKNCPQQDDMKNSGVFMCKYLQYWARGERLPFDAKNLVAARLVLLYEVKNRVLTDQKTWEEDLKQIVARGRSDFLDKKMEKSSSSKVAFEGSTKIKLKLTQAPEPQKDHEKQPDQSTQAMQPLKVREKESKQCTQVDCRQKKPEWLERFFKRTFFDSCSEHPIRRNELNKYCIDCDASLCQYCLSLASHANHRLLKIYRHVYKDVVPLDEIERHIDCSQIQPYRCNRQMVIALTPLPHSGGKTNDEATCQTCNRKLIEYDVYSYCSISCKVEAFSKKENESSPPFLSLDQSVQEAEENDSSPPKPKKTTRKRKGIPHRAPLS